MRGKKKARGRDEKGRRYRVVRRRYRLQTELWLWANRRATERKGDPEIFNRADLVKVLKPGATIIYHHRETIG